jgi:16S rRNA (cytosine1402-N4)-methyltransferase
MTEQSDHPQGPDQPPRRRKRYSGTHPKQFQDRYKELAPEKYPEVQGHVRGQGRTPAGTHVPIMVVEVMAALQPLSGEIVADCTLGYGGHAEAFMERIGPAGRLIGFDLDAGQLERTGERLAGLAVPISLHHSSFAGIGNVLGKDGIEGFDVIFADLGVSSMQIDDPSRGFSYKHEGPLDMRMDARLKRTAADLVNSLSQEELSQSLADLADEPDCERIAEAIVRQRQSRRIASTFDLVDVVLGIKGLTRRRWSQRPAQQQRDLHPAARTFQTLRILVNDELGNLKQLLRVAPFCLKTGGRVGMLTFHSGEERLVERAFAAGLADGTYAAVNSEAIRPGPQEVASNPRARPARLRWARKP